MKYPLILKYNYSYVSSGNYYQKAEREYYQLFTDLKNSKTFSLSTLVRDIVVDVESISEDEISFTHQYRVYVKPYTSCRELEDVTSAYTLKKGEAVECKCVDLYWRYASGGENAPATLSVEWVSYEDFFDACMNEVLQNSVKADGFAEFLIEDGQYDLAFKILTDSGWRSRALGLCYEMGYGTEKNLEKALEIYIGLFSTYATNSAIERILTEMEGKEVKFDDVKRTVLLEKYGYYGEAYHSAKIATEAGDNTPQAMRRNAELNIAAFLEQGYPYNNPSENLQALAKYYEMVNEVPENERKVYYESWVEEDEYDGGYFHHSVFHEKLAIETFQKEVEKNDLLVLGVLLNQYPDKIENKEDILAGLQTIAKEGIQKDSGFANYCLGLYYKRRLKDKESAYVYFEEALKQEFHLAIIHLAKKYVEEDPASAYEKIAKHHPYVPQRHGKCISWDAKDYYTIWDSLQ